MTDKKVSGGKLRRHEMPSKLGCVLVDEKTGALTTVELQNAKGKVFHHVFFSTRKEGERYRHGKGEKVVLARLTWIDKESPDGRQES